MCSAALGSPVLTQPAACPRAPSRGFTSPAITSHVIFHLHVTPGSCGEGPGWILVSWCWLGRDLLQEGVVSGAPARGAVLLAGDSGSWERVRMGVCAECLGEPDCR